MTYLPHEEQEQSEPQLPIAYQYTFLWKLACMVRHTGPQEDIGRGRRNVQLEVPEHPHSPFMIADLRSLVWFGRLF